MDKFDEWFDKEFPEDCEARKIPYLRAYCRDTWYAALKTKGE